SNEFSRGVCLRRRGVHRKVLPLRRYAIGERVGVKIGVITQTVPGTIFLGCLADAGFLACCIIIPRIVPSDGEERPVGALQMLHQYVAGRGVVSRAWQFT